MLPEDNTSSNFGKPFLRHSLFCNALKRCLLRFVWERASHRFPTAGLEVSPAQSTHQEQYCQLLIISLFNTLSCMESLTALSSRQNTMPKNLPLEIVSTKCSGSRCRISDSWIELNQISMQTHCVDGFLLISVNLGSFTRYITLDLPFFRPNPPS